MEKEHRMVLSGYVLAYGLARVVSELSSICSGFSEEWAEYQDTTAAKAWMNKSQKLDNLTAKLD